MTKIVLIVEDNELNMKLFNDLLQAHGFSTICAATGEQGLEMAREHWPDLILLDINLPGIQGTDVAREIRKNPSYRAPIIAITAFAMKGDEERIRESGCEGYLPKPISIGKFMRTVQSYLGIVERAA